MEAIFFNQTNEELLKLDGTSKKTAQKMRKNLIIKDGKI